MRKALLPITALLIPLIIAVASAGSALAAGNAVRFCVTGDSRGSMTRRNGPVNKEVISKMVAAIKKEKPDFVIFSGDLVLGYSKDLEKQLTLWRDSFMKPLLDAKIPVYACRGNHDQSLGGGKKSKGKKPEDIWNKVFSGKFAFPANGPSNARNMTYFVRKGNVLILVLDNYSGGKKGRNQVDVGWMKSVLAKETKKSPLPLHVFAMCHEPAFTVIHPDCLAVKAKQRDDFVKAFLKNGGVAFFCGHDHIYDHSQIKYPEGIFHQFVCGTAGAPLKKKWKGKYPDKRVRNVKTSVSFGYAVVDVKDSNATITAKVWPGDKAKGSLKKIDALSYDLSEKGK